MTWRPNCPVAPVTTMLTMIPFGSFALSGGTTTARYGNFPKGSTHFKVRYRPLGKLES